MTDLRPSTPQQRRELKALTRRLIEMAGGVSSFEHVTRVKGPQLSKYGSLDEEAFIPIDVVLDLMLDTGSNGFLSYLAAQRGMKLVALEADGEGAALPGIMDIADIVDGSSGLVNLVSIAIADGKITRNEARPIKAKIEVEVQKLRALGRTVDASVTGGAE